MTFTELSKAWKTWGVPAFVELLAPWQDRISGLKLISAFYQPELNAFCSVLGALGAMFAYVFAAGTSRVRRRRWAIALAVLFAVSFIVTLALRLTIDIVCNPGPKWAAIVTVTWHLSYILMFVSSGSLMVILLSLRSANASPRAPRPTRGRQPDSEIGRRRAD